MLTQWFHICRSILQSPVLVSLSSHFHHAETRVIIFNIYIIYIGLFYNIDLSVSLLDLSALAFNKSYWAKSTNHVRGKSSENLLFTPADEVLGSCLNW